MRIQKYNIYFISHMQKTELHIPVNSTILKIAKQDTMICIWFEEPDSAAVTEIRTFCCIHTGSKFDKIDLDFVATVVYNDDYVVHIYEKSKFLTAEDMEL